MNIAFYTCGFGYTGGNKRVLRLSEELVKLNQNVHVIVSHDFRTREIAEYPCKVIHHKEALNNYYDLVIAFNPVFCADEVFDELKSKYRGLYILHGNEPKRYTPAYQKWIDKYKGDNNFFVFGNNPDWRTFYNIKGLKYHFDLIGGIDIKPFPAKRTLKKKVFKVVCNASNVDWKGLDMIIEALERWRLNSEIEIIAFASQRTNVFCSRWPMKIYVNMPYENMPYIYREGDVYVYMEGEQAGWGNTALEAIMCGVPVVCSEYGTKSFAVHLNNAFVIKRNVSVLRDALEYLYENAELRKSLVKPVKIRKMIYDKYSYKKLAENLLSYIYEIGIN